MSIYDYVVRDAGGNDVSMSDYKGKVLLIVNTATDCEFTPQYKGLEALYRKYRDQGFEILDFPCNQFVNQAPGTEEEIWEFCKLNYDTTFKLFAKIDVNGKNEAPLYKYLKTQKPGSLSGAIKWNFTKFLVDKEGNVVERFGPIDIPSKIDKSVKGLL